MPHTTSTICSVPKIQEILKPTCSFGPSRKYFRKLFKLCLTSPKETLLCVVDKWLRKAGIHDMREQTPFTTHQKVRHSMILTSRYRRTKHRGLWFRRFECTNAEGGRIARVSLLAGRL